MSVYSRCNIRVNARFTKGDGTPFIAIDPATKSGDYTAMTHGEIMSDGRIFIKNVTFSHDELGPITEKKRALEYTVDWCVGAQVQTVLRTTDRKKVLELHEKLHNLASRLNALGVDVCVEMSSETVMVVVKSKVKS